MYLEHSVLSWPGLYKTLSIHDSQEEGKDKRSLNTLRHPQHKFHEQMGGRLFEDDERDGSFRSRQ